MLGNPELLPAPALPRVGDVIEGRYRILSKLSEGGMGSIFRVYDAIAQEEVALKVALPSVCDAHARTMHEADVLARAATKGVPSLRDFGRVGESAFLTMDLIEGQDLQTYLSAHGRLPVSAALSIVSSIAQILRDVHEQGVTHRDIKPSNIIIENATLSVALLDFGIARATDEGDDVDGVSGSPRYMSPEQMLGKPTDHRGDVWSLGVTLYELVVGCAPFHRTTLTAMLTAMLTDSVVPPSQIVEGLPVELDNIVTRCLAIDPGHRYDDMSELIDALESAKKIVDGAMSPVRLAA